MKIRKVLRILNAVIGALVLLVVQALPALALSDPTTPPAFTSSGTPQYGAFWSVSETNDLLVVAEGYVNYATTPSETASEAYLFQLLDTTGTAIIQQTPLVSFGNRPISLYFTAAQVTALGLVYGTAYGIRLTPNPLLLASSAANTVTAYLSGSTWTNLATWAASSNDTTLNPLRILCLNIATNMQSHDAAVPGYVIAFNGIRYLSSQTTVNTQTVSTTVYGSVTSGNTTYSTTAGSQNTTTIVEGISGGSIYTSGADLFLAGVPSLNVFVPSLFASLTIPMSGDAPSAPGTYAATLTTDAKLGNPTANALRMLGTFLTGNPSTGAWIAMLLLILLLALVAYAKTESGLVVLAVVVAALPLGTYLGLMSMAMLFVLGMSVLVLGAFYFFTRGIL